MKRRCYWSACIQLADGQRVRISGEEDGERYPEVIAKSAQAILSDVEGLQTSERMSVDGKFSLEMEVVSWMM